MDFKKHTDDKGKKKERVALITVMVILLILFFFSSCSSCSNLEYAYYQKNWIEHQTHLKEEPKIQCDFCMDRYPYFVN